VTARIVDGRAIAQAIADGARVAALELQRCGRPRPSIAVVRVGADAASVRYANQIERIYREAGFGFRLAAQSDTIDDVGLGAALRAIGADPTVSGILLQLPLPGHLAEERATEAIDPTKDVDGVNACNAGRLFLGRGHAFAPATALGGLEVLRWLGVSLAGKHAVVVGRSEIVGRPLAMLLLREDATVTICHSRTVDLARYTRQADVLAVAVGRPELITGDMVAPGATVLDFGTNVVQGKLVGDVAFASVAAVAGAITPVPGGTGPVTNALLLRNTLQASRWQAGEG
jgi:methylenetetrahydrofolate dehydrogenase (NADP+)/methenyltetrahydrofolate cyclohydrolase